MNFIKAPLEPQSSVTRLERKDKFVGLVWACSLVFFFFFFFSKINLYLKQNVKFRFYKIKIMHANKLFLCNAMK